MAELTPQQAQQIQALAANVEVAYREIVRSRTALSYLIVAGKATCEDIRTYNLVAKSTYFYQKSMSDLIRGAGGQAPAIPEPVYITWRGIAGDQAAAIDCSSGQMRGWAPNGLGDFFVNPKDVEWRTGPLPSDVAAVQQLLGSVKVAPPPGDLGAAPVIAIISIVLIGIVVAVTGYIALKLVEAFTGLPQRIEQTRQTAIVAERHRAVLEARQACLARCAEQGGSAITCAKSCERVLPDFKPPGAGGIGILGWVLGLLIVGGAVYLGYRAWVGRDRWLPARASGGDDELDGPDDTDHGDYIDAEYVER